MENCKFITGNLYRQEVEKELSIQQALGKTTLIAFSNGNGDDFMTFCVTGHPARILNHKELVEYIKKMDVSHAAIFDARLQEYLRIEDMLPPCELWCEICQEYIDSEADSIQQINCPKCSAILYEPLEVVKG